MSILPLLLLSALLPAVDASRVEEAVLRAYEEGDIQRELPTPPRRVTPAPGTSVASAGRSMPEVPRADSALAETMRALLWTLAAALLCLAAVWAAREWAPFWPGGPRRARARKRAPPGGEAREVAPAAAPLLPEHARLAEEGRFTEAVHALLARALWELERRGRRPFPPALTSREILGHVAVEPIRAPLEGLVRAVERTVFGGEEAHERDYRECEGRYTEILAAGEGR